MELNLVITWMSLEVDATPDENPGGQDLDLSLVRPKVENLSQLSQPGLLNLQNSEIINFKMLSLWSFTMPQWRPNTVTFELRLE